KLRVGVLFDNDHRAGDEDKVLRPEECKTPPSTPPSSAPPSTPPSSAPPSTPPSSTPPSSPAPGEPTPIIEMGCDSITFGLDNPADGDEIKVIITTSKGETRELTVAPGEKKTEKFSATPGFVLTLKDVASGETVELPYTQPEDCDSAGNGGGDGELPLT